jgi:hypothetical protein
MKLTNFLIEAERVSTIQKKLIQSPEEDRPKFTPDQKAAQKQMRALGDVGQVDMVRGMNPGEPDPSNRSEFIGQGQKTAERTSNVKFGDEQDPVDRMLAQTAPVAKFQKKKEAERAQQRKDLGTRPSDLRQPDVIHDARGNVKPSYTKYQQRIRDQKAFDKKAAELEGSGLDVDEKGQTAFDKLSARQRANRTIDINKPLGRLDAESEVSQALRDAQVLSQVDTLRQPVPMNVRGKEFAITDVPYLRAGYQNPGLGIAAKNEIDDDAIDLIIAGTRDTDKYSPIGEPIDAETLQNRSGAETTRVQDPTTRDLKNIQPEVLANDPSANLTDEQIERQTKFFNALSQQDSKGIQKLSFTHKVSPEMVKKFIDRFGTSTQDNEFLISKLKNAGNTAPMTARYGGDLGREGRQFQVPGAPKGVYDLERMKKENNDLFNKAEANRAFSIIETYLKQGGRDAYAQHEGIRSIADMDLEHIRSLRDPKDAKGNPLEGGFDHPDNWVFAGGELNKLRGNKSLAGKTTTARAFGDEVIDMDNSQVRGSFEEFLSALAGVDSTKPKGRAGREWDTLRRTALEMLTDPNEGDEMIGRPTGGRASDRGIFAPETMRNRTPDEVRELRQKLVNNFNISAEMAANMVPEPRRRYDVSSLTGVRPSAKIGQQNRIEGKPYTADPKQYEQDVITNVRDQVMYNKAVQIFKDELGINPETGKKYNEEDLYDDPDFIRFQANMALMGPSAAPEDREESQPRERAGRRRGL